MYLRHLAEREGFEPSNGLPRYILSRDAPSTGLGHLSNQFAARSKSKRNFSGQIGGCAR